VSCIGGPELQGNADRYSALLEGKRPVDGLAACGFTYFLMSLRFQQAVSLAAFSLVIGMSVV
jgi:hypothetical protein